MIEKVVRVTTRGRSTLSASLACARSRGGDVTRAWGIV
ncbi:hypothetical protein O7A70_31440 [Mesorhizobium sp. Cs1299R1N1]